jgi:hypothetical protein
MSWIPQFNIPAFEAATVKLREAGYEVISPVEEDNPEVYRRALASETGEPGAVTGIETWGDMLARDVKIVSDMVEGIVFLDGWEDSRGARLEAFVGVLCGRKFYRYIPDGELEEMHAKLVLTKVARHTNRAIDGA